MQKRRSVWMNGFSALLLLLLAGRAVGQQDGYLMLVDADNRMPFTARIGETLVQSSAHGHLLFPRLADSIYQVIIAFPKKNIPDQVFPVVMHKKDQGLVLKGADSAWVMYNWQTRETIRPLKEVDSSIFLAKGVRREDGFSRLMAAVVNDSSVMYNTYAGRSLARDSIAGIKPRDSLKLTRSGRKKALDSLKSQKPAGLAVTPPLAKDTITITASNAGSRKPGAGTNVRKLREVTLKISRKIVYIDQGADGRSDTVTCFVFFEKDSTGLAARQNTAPAGSKIKSGADSATAVAVPALKKDSTVAVATGVKKDSGYSVARLRKDSLAAVAKARKDSISAVAKARRESLAATAKFRRDSVAAVAKARKDSTATAVKNRKTAARADSLRAAGLPAQDAVPAPAVAASGNTIINTAAAPAPKADSGRSTAKTAPACTQSASESDVESLRSAILNVNSVQDKLSILYGAFAVKCFSAAQVRVLATLFVSDKSRYRLFEMGAGHVSDPENFTGLSDLLTDKAYLKKFKSLAENKG